MVCSAEYCCINVNTCATHSCETATHTEQAKKGVSPLALRSGHCSDAVLAPEPILGDFAVAQLSELVGAERLGGETLSPTGAACERSRPGSAYRIHCCAYESFLVLSCPLLSPCKSRQTANAAQRAVNYFASV